jgi:hypothetical protein
MIRAVQHDRLPVVDGVAGRDSKGVTMWQIRHLMVQAVIDDEAPVGEHVLFLVAGTMGATTEAIAERVAELLARHGLSDVPDDAGELSHE